MMHGRKNIKLNFIQWRLILRGPQYGISFMSTFLRLDFRENLCVPAITIPANYIKLLSAFQTLQWWTKNPASVMIMTSTLMIGQSGSPKYLLIAILYFVKEAKSENYIQ